MDNSSEESKTRRIILDKKTKEIIANIPRNIVFSVKKYVPIGPPTMARVKKRSLYIMALIGHNINISTVYTKKRGLRDGENARCSGCLDK